MFFCCVCCQVEVSATSWSLAQRSPADCDASLCVIKKPRGREGHSSRWAAEPEIIIIIIIHILLIYYILTTGISCNTHISPLAEHCHNSKNTTFQKRVKTTGRDNTIASKEQHFSPLATILRNRRVKLFYQVDMVSGIPPMDITQNERFLRCDTLLLGVRYIYIYIYIYMHNLA
jgi:hypothetical protein